MNSNFTKIKMSLIGMILFIATISLHVLASEIPGSVPDLKNSSLSELPGRNEINSMELNLKRSVVYSTDFESFTIGGQVACQDPVNWSTWSNTPCTSEDGYISGDFAYSGAKSAKIENLTDMLLLLGDKTSGNYELSWWMYIENNNAGYYNIQHFEAPGQEFAFEIYFLQNGTAEFTTMAQPAIIFNYPKATWFQVKHMINIDTDLIALTINNNVIHSWPLSAVSNSITPGTKQLGSVDFYAGASGSEIPKYFIDDVVFQEAQTIENDLAIQAVISPSTGPNLSSNELVTVKVINFGSTPQSDISVSYSINGGSAVEEIISTTLNTSESIDYTFTATADLSQVQSYEISATVVLAADEAPDNNSLSKIVENLGSQILMQNGTINTCNGIFLDTGGANDGYQPNENLTLTITPSTSGAKLKLIFTEFNTENNFDFLKIYDGLNVSDPLLGNFHGTTMPPEIIASDDNNSGALTFLFTSDGSVQGTGWMAEISCIAPMDHDLMGNAVTGPTALEVGSTENFNVIVTNAGLYSESGSNYTVSLFDANHVEIGTVVGTDIAVGESKSFVFAWTPQIVGSTHLYGKVQLTGDENSNNNQTPAFNISVMPTGQQDIVVGTGTELSSNIPIYPYFGYSFSQTLYLQSELNVANKRIFRIGYQYGGPSENLEFDIEVWLAHTTQSEITASVPLSGFTKVYDGPYVVSTGESFSTVDIDGFFYNNTENLIVTIIEKKPGWSSPSDQFYSTPNTLPQNLCIGAWNDQTPYDPNNLPAGNLVSSRANIKLWMGDMPTDPAARTTPSELNFGAMEASVPKVLQAEVMNIGGGTLIITGADITNNRYTLIDAVFPVSLGMGEKHIFNVQFIASEPGLEQGTLSFLMDENIPGSKVVDLTGIGLRFGILRESFEGELFPPLGWKVVDVNGDSKGWLRNTGFVPTGQTAPRTGIACASLDVYAGNPSQISYDDWLITPEMIWQEGDFFSFWIKRVANQNGQNWKIGYSTSGSDPSDFIIIDEIIDPSLSYTEKSYNMSDLGLIDGETYYMAFQFNSLWCWPGVIDDVMGSVLNRFENDLMVIDFQSENEFLYLNTPTNYQLEIANFGMNPLQEGQYILQLATYINGIETILSQVDGPALNPGELITVNLQTTFTELGVYGVYAKIVWAEDLNLVNNISDVIEVEVFENSIIIKHIGDFPISAQTSYYNYYPVNLEDNRGASLSQSLYPVNELNTGGIIERIAYYRNMSDNMAQRKVKVWMGETAVGSLDAYIPPSQLQLVFDGKIDFNEGIGRVNIPLSEPFVYSGSGNLVVSVYYFDGPTYSNNAKFAYKAPDYGPNRTIFESGWTSINPENPVYVGTTINYPNTTLLFNTGNGLGNINGRVLYQADNMPVEGALIEFINPAFPEANAQVMSTEQGYYNAPYIMAGENLTVVVSKYGYSDVVYQNVNLLPGGNINLGNALLVVRPQITLSGNVIKSDSQSPAQQATVKISGLDNYETTTDTDGNFSFNAVWGSTSYQIEVALQGYQLYTESVSVPDQNYILPTITLLENAPSPNVVSAIEEAGNAIVNWFAAGQPYPKLFRYDDGTVMGVLITPGSPDIIGGSAWKYDAIIQSVQWYTYQSPNYPSSSEVKITILGLNPDNSPNPADVIFTHENYVNSYGWNSFTLPEPVHAPSGFFVGISGYNNYTLLAYDDGVGEPWEWNPRTQWSNGLGSFNPLENATSPPLRANIFMRAAGLTNGPLEQMSASNDFIVDLNSNKTILITDAVQSFTTDEPAVLIKVDATESSKAFMHYNVFRKSVESDDWLLLNVAPVSDTSFVDASFSSLPYGIYEYGVQAVYSNNVLSEMAVSNELEKDMRLMLNLTVNNNTGIQSVSNGAIVSLTNLDGNPSHIYSGIVGPDGIVNIPDILKGMYSLSVVHTGFENYTDPSVNLEVEGVVYAMSVEIIERLDNPYDVEIITAGQPLGTAMFLWNQEPDFDNVDSYSAFITSNIGKWKVVDQDAQLTVYPAGVSYPNMGEPMAFMVMNRAQTTPPLSEAYWGAHSGNQYFAGFGSTSGSTNNWLISEQQNHTLPYTFSFYAKSVTDNYGLETFRIGYSTQTDNISDFIFITGNEIALTYWTKFSYNIPAEAKYVTIRHNYTGFALLVDDITIGIESDGAIPGNGFSIFLNQDEVISGIETKAYDFSNLIPGEYTAGVKAVYYTGESEIISVDFVLPEGTPVQFNVNDGNGVPVSNALVEISFENETIFSGYTLDGSIQTQLYPGNYQYIVSKPDYADVTGSFNLSANPLTIDVVLQDNFEITFNVENESEQPVSGANIVIGGLSQTTGSDGTAVFALQPGEYPYAVTHPDYQRVLSTITVNTNANITVVMPVLYCEPANNLSYTQTQNNVTLNWQAPVIGEDGTWIHWDGVHNNNSVGTGGPVDFDVAQRFLPSDLISYNDKFLTRVLFVPREAACTYSVRVWTGGAISGPENLVVDQLVTNPVIGSWNEIFLDIPVLIDSSQELWIGFRNNTTTGHPAGTDAGPAVDGKGNMINLAGNGWQTLLQVAPTLNYNWSIRGLVESTDLRFTELLMPLDEPDRGSLNGSLTSAMSDDRNVLTEPRILNGYNVYRNGQKINTQVISGMSYNDNNLDIGNYDYFVTSVWSNGCESEPSNIVNVVVEEMDCPIPSNLQVWVDEENPNLIHLVWNEEDEAEFRFDDGVRTGQLGFQTGTSNGVVGAAHPYPATLSQMSWLLSDAPDGGGPHETVSIYVFGLLATGTPNSNDLLFNSVVTNVDGQWNTFSFPESIIAPNGFFMGVAYDGFVGLGTDDGIGEPYVYQPNTHFYSGNYTAGAWTAWETSGFSVNGMIRALGVAGAKIATEVNALSGMIDESFVYYKNDDALPLSEPLWKLSDERNLLGYNIYHQGVLMESLWQETSYSYTEMQISSHCYKVSAVYSDCGESEFSDEECVPVLVGEMENEEVELIQIYPNPARKFITVEGQKMNSMIIVDAKGHKVMDMSNITSNKVNLDISKYASGLYLFIVRIDDRVETKRIVIE
ncbi:MAG: hypothetical protein CVT92_01040 [Bacteroidetes bacterium HGW-Bacteroidetes-1]|jgi:hypothetical protein|nr:MAG: hypothetical protein CVT92_01040 [Bacteroidetes bacterium HGW-Bacteroidetes-1]